MESATFTRRSPGSIRLARLRAVPPRSWARIGFAAMCVGALIGYFAFPTYPTYDSFYALLWGRDLLHLHLPDFRVYRGPTEHPLAIAFGMFCSIFGQGGARLMVLGSIASFVAAVAGMYRLGRLCFGPVVGLVAALLLLSRFFVENLAAQGYLDITYVALIVWAIVLEVERPRRGAPVFLVLAAAGLLRPDAWVLSGAYWLWCSWRADNRTRLKYLALALVAPVLWAGLDTAVTGDPLYSLSATAGLAAELERTQGFTSVVGSLWSYGVRIDKLPVLLGGLIGLPLAIWMAPRRVLVPLATLVLLMGVYVAEGAVGASVVDRYLMGGATVLLLFCAVAIGGWAMLEPGSWLRRLWIVGAAALVVYGTASVATTLSLSSLRTTLAYHEDFHEGLATALASPKVKAELRRCPLVSLPDNKLIPDARWILDSVGQGDIVARSQARADVEHGAHELEDRIRAGSVAVYPLGDAVFVEAIVNPGDDPRDQIPLSGFRRIYTSRYYAVYANCWSMIGERSKTRPGRARRWAWAALAVVLVGGLALRLWGVRQGLPYVYNTDEADHFVPHAVTMFTQGTLNPHYFANPPAFTYLLHYLFAIAYGGGHGVERELALHPTAVYTLARVAAAVLGTLALWLLYATGARLFNRAVGVLAAAIEAVAFLPVFYAHLALNDAPTLAPLTLSLLGTAGILRKGRVRDHLIAGLGLGLACASKYTAGIVIVPLLAAVIARYLDAGEHAGRRALGGLALAGSCALAAFVIANPYAVLDYTSFHGELVHQSTLSAEAQGKLGAPKHGGVEYYLWSLTWGLGWVPALAALGGAVSVWRVQRRLGWLLVPAPLLFLAFMGLQGRYFGRWLLPIFPILCLLAACLAWQAADAGGRLLARRRRVHDPHAPGGGARAWRTVLGTLIVAALLAQGLIYSVHSGLVLSRADTRTLTREWMLAHIPAGTAIVVEPVSPDDWARETAPGTSTASNSYRWNKYPSLLSRIAPDGSLEPGVTHRVGIEDYERTLSPTLIDYYEAHGYCWVLTGSTQSDRAFADPGAVPEAYAYYNALAEQGEVVYRASPYARGEGPVAFNFDWSFDYYPLAYHRPGPQMTLYRLHGGRCRG